LIDAHRRIEVCALTHGRPPNNALRMNPRFVGGLRLEDEAA
jgi:hypothetical protein